MSLSVLTLPGMSALGFPPHQILFISEFAYLVFILSEKVMARQEFPLAWVAEGCLILGQWPVVFVLHPCVHLF